MTGACVDSSGTLARTGSSRVEFCAAGRAKAKMAEKGDPSGDLEISRAAVFKKSKDDSLDFRTVAEGYDFNRGVDYEAILSGYFKQGFQATNYAIAVEEITKMLEWRADDEDVGKDEGSQTGCKIFLGYTSSTTSSGLRETYRYLLEHRMVDVVVTTAGGVEEDLIKCLADTYVASFNLDDSKLRESGLNRIGNLIVPNNNYCLFEDWIMPILDKMLEEQRECGTTWTPSKVIHRLGKEINDRRSICYWAYRNNIPIYCPALTDGSLGDMIYFHSYRNPGLVIDICRDIRNINSEAVFSKKTGIIIIGTGIVKHHICNANLMVWIRTLGLW